MKKYSFIFFAIFMFLSCESFLDEEPRSQRPIGGTTLEDAQASVDGIYAFLREPYNRTGFADLAFSAVEVTTGQYEPLVAQDGNAQDAFNLNFTRINAHFQRYWNSCYGGIEAANIAIDNIPNITDSNLTEEKRSQLLGEAHFMRAYYYFVLVQLFGDIPMNITPTQGPADSQLPKSSVQEIYEMVIVPDLLIAENSGLPSTDTSGRTSLGAVKSLLAKVYLTMAGFPLNQTDKHALARNKAKEVIDNGWYSLFQSDGTTTWFNKLNASSFDNTEEHIFMVQYQFGLVNNTMSIYFAPVSAASVITISSIHFGGMAPTDEFLGSYAAEDLRAQNQGFFFDSLEGNNFELSVYKYFDEAFRETAPFASKNIPLLRYADVLLTFAEAQNAADGSPNAEAYEAINAVRERAGLAPLSGLSSGDFQEAVWRERAWELTCEGQVWYDMKRTQQAFNGAGFEPLVGFAKPNGATVGQDNIYFPIPQSEIDTNPLLDD